MKKELTNEQVQALHGLRKAAEATRTAMEEDYPNYAARLGEVIRHTEDIQGLGAAEAELVLCGKCAAEYEVYHNGFFAEKIRDLTRGKENCRICGRRHYCGLYRVEELPY